MPLFMCPNCDTEMKEVNRSGVQIDMCPSCRGVWLDRGELEKLMTAAQNAVSQGNDAGGRGSVPQGGERGYGGEGGYGGERGGPRKKKENPLSEIFEIFGG